MQRRVVRRVHLCRRQAPLHGVSGATRPQIICPQRRCASSHRLTQWRVTELYGRKGVGGSKDAAKIVYSVCCDGFLTRVKVSRRWHMLPARRPCKHFWGTASGDGMPATSLRDDRRLIQSRVTELYGAQRRRRWRRCREDGSSWVSPFCVSALSRFLDHECPYI